MRRLTLVLVVLVLNTLPVAAQSVSGTAWLDLFDGPDGAVVYPQYSFNVKTEKLVVTGYGFWEKAPQEPDFTNHVNTVTWPRLPQFSVRTEVGGRVREFQVGTIKVPPAGFFQVGPQANLHQVVPPLQRVMDYLVISQLPGLTGIRPPNTILAGGTKKFPLGKGIAVSAEGYRRFLPGGQPDYSEYWVLIHPPVSHLALGVFLLQDGKAKSLAVGGRLSP